MLSKKDDIVYFLWYNVSIMKTKTPQRYYTPYQVRLPVDFEKIIEISDSVYTFSEVMENIDLSEYLATEERGAGRPRYDSYALMKVILFAFMENGYVSTREIEKSCKTDIRYMWLLQTLEAPSHMTIANFMNNNLKGNIDGIFEKINEYIFEEKDVDLNHVYIDGTKIRANANMYSWVWKKSCQKNRDNVFGKVTKLISLMNDDLKYYGVKIETRDEYAIEYLENIKSLYGRVYGIDSDNIKRGRGHHKTSYQRYYDEFVEYIRKLKNYAKNIKICGDYRNSYSKTDNDATFMRMKRDHMGNDQLLPGYNIQLGVCDEYVAVYDIKQYASDMDCFIPLMDKFNSHYGIYPEYPVADAGYGSYNNYLYCEEHGMKKYMKFTMYEKETKDSKYQSDPFRAVNFGIDEGGNPICPAGKRFYYLKSAPIRGNKYGRTEEYYQCEDCKGCPLKERCHKASGNRIVRLNEELTTFHCEVLDNLNSTHGALLRRNRSIQAEGAYGSIKWNRSYVRARRRGLKELFLEIGMICCGFNLHKYHLKKLKTLPSAS